MPIKFTVTGRDGADQEWTCTGETPGNGNADCYDQVMSAVFDQLTSGKAVFGRPGVGCCGPYKVTRVSMEFP